MAKEQFRRGFWKDFQTEQASDLTCIEKALARHVGFPSDIASLEPPGAYVGVIAVHA